MLIDRCCVLFVGCCVLRVLRLMCVVRCALRAACRLFVGCCVLFGVCFVWLRVVRCLMFAVSRLLLVGWFLLCCVLFGMCRLLFVG